MKYWQLILLILAFTHWNNMLKTYELNKVINPTLIDRISFPTSRIKLTNFPLANTIFGWQSSKWRFNSTRIKIFFKSKNLIAYILYTMDSRRSKSLQVEKRPKKLRHKSRNLAEPHRQYRLFESVFVAEKQKSSCNIDRIGQTLAVCLGQLHLSGE